MSRRVRFQTEHADAEAVAAALEPDNTDEMSIHVEDGTVVTTIRRETTGGLRTTADDYVSNLSVADRLTSEIVDAGIETETTNARTETNTTTTDTNTQS